MERDRAAHVASRVGRRVINGVQRYYVKPSAQEQSRALLTLAILLFALVGTQSFLVQCRKQHERAYITTALVGLWVIPALVAIHQLWPYMLCVWSLFTVTMGHVVFMATRPAISPRTPRYVYKWFAGVTQGCFGLVAVGYAILLSDLFRLEEVLFHVDGYALALGFSLVFYGLYLGVLGRDCASVCSDVMASRMALAPRHGDHRREPPDSLCCLCGGALLQPDRGMAREDAAGAGGDDDDDTAFLLAAEERTVTLQCGHRYHEHCVRGWIIIGKKDTCAFCNERVEVKTVFPWERHSLMWMQILDAIRYFIVWNPIIICVVQLVIWLLAGSGGGSIGGY